VTIDGEDVTITGAGPTEIRLKPGRYRWRAVKDGQPIQDDSVTIARGKTQIVRIGFEGKNSAQRNLVVAPPIPTSPLQGAILDNGRMDHSDPIIWDFAWQAVPGATKYQLFVIGANAPFPLINISDLASPSYHHEGRGAYVANHNRFGWRWKVRAMVDG